MPTFDALDDEFVARWTGWYQAPTAVGASCLLQWLGTGKGADLIATAVVRLRLLRVHIPGLRPFLAQVHASRESLRTFIRFPTVVPEAASEFLANMQRYFARVRVFIHGSSRPISWQPAAPAPRRPDSCP
jgi:hypothetical protein